MRLLIVTSFILIVTVLSAAASCADDGTNIIPMDSRAVVARWLELHRTGKRDDASALTTGSRKHRASVILPFNRDTGVRVVRSLGNERVAAVITGARKVRRADEQVLLFWLEQREGVWRINKSDSFEKRVAEERLRGFLEAGDVRWHVQREQVVGNWEAGPCRPPVTNGLACGCDLQLRDDNRYRLLVWGPGGPDPTGAVQGDWRIAEGKIMLSHQDRTFECLVTWISGDQLEIESPDGKVSAAYVRENRDDAIFLLNVK